ncbi:ribose-phosphate diphosphokinase [Candidatus Woesearchaeota archaeon]|nr:ribose-phosphate diphosphokinase [Candidatus Woesearchaeota archaeon]
MKYEQYDNAPEEVRDALDEKDLWKLSDMVIVNGRSAEHFTEILIPKFHERVDKEFRHVSLKNRALLAFIKKNILKPADKIIKDHRDSEIFVQLKTNIRNKDVHVIQTFGDRKNRDLMELFILNDALNRAGANSITNYLLYIPYQRQDKKDDGRVSISSKLIFNLIKESSGGKLKRMVTFDLHARQAQAHFDGPVDEIQALPLFASYYKDLLKHLFNEDGTTDQIGIISPDAGGAKRAERLAKLLGTRYYVLDKKRVAHGEAKFNFFLDWDGKGKHAILVDDMIDTGGSLVEPIKYLQNKGATVYACCTHPLFSKKGETTAEEKLGSTGVKILTTDSLPEKYRGYFAEHKWLTIVSLAFNIAKMMYCNQIGDSVSTFMEKAEDLIERKALDINIYDVEGEEIKQIDMNGI